MEKKGEKKAREGERRRNRMKIASSISPKSNYTVAGLKIEGTGSEILRSRQTKSFPHLCSWPPKRNEPDRDGDGETETEREREGGRERERERARSNVS